MNRRSERERAFKIVYESLINEDLDYNKALENHGLKIKDGSYLYDFFKNFSNNLDSLKNLMDKEVGVPSFIKTNKIDASIILTSLNEMIYLGIPSSVSINEAVDLSKKYSEGNSYKFVNKVLGNIQRKEEIK